MSENYNDKLQELLNTQKAMEDAKKDPQNTEITKVLTFYIGEQVYGIEIPDVIEIIEVPPITAVPGVPSYIKGIINVRSKIVPVVNIRSRFGKEEIPFNDRTCLTSFLRLRVRLSVLKRQGRALFHRSFQEWT